MAYSSGQCAAKIREYEAVIGAIGGLGGGISSCGTCIAGDNGSGGVNAYTSKLIISGKTIDDGKLASIASNVSNIPAMLSPVVDECEQKITLWKRLYNEALAREQKEARKLKGRVNLVQ